MQRTRLFVGALLILIPGLVTVIACQSYAIGQAAARPTAIGTIDINRVFEGLDDRAAIDARLNVMAEELQAKSEQLAAEIDELQEEVEAYTVGSDKHQEMLEQLQLKSLEYQAFAEFSRRKIDVHKVLELRRLFDAIRKAAEVLAIDMGYDIVMIDDSVNDVVGGTEADVRVQILSRQVLYTNPEIDLTDVLVDRMNQP